MLMINIQPAPAVSYRSSTATVYGTNTNTVLTAPSGIQNGDLLLIFFAIGAASPPTPTPPSGFTACAGSWPASVSHSGFTVDDYCWQKIANNESGNYTVTQASASTQGYIGAYSGADPSAPLAPTPTLANGTGATSTATGLTTARPNSVVVFLEQDWGDNANNLSPPTGSTPTFTKHAGETAQAGIIFAADGVLAAAAATGNKSITNNNVSGSGDPWVAALVAIEPPVCAARLPMTGSGC